MTGFMEIGLSSASPVIEWYDIAGVGSQLFVPRDTSDYVYITTNDGLIIQMRMGTTRMQKYFSTTTSATNLHMYYLAGSSLHVLQD